MNASEETYVPVTTSGGLYFTQLGVIQPGPERLVRLSGDLLTQFAYADLRRSPLSIVEMPVLNASLSGGLAFALPFDNETLLELRDSLISISSPAEPGGWNKVVRPGVSVLEVTPTTISFMVPPTPAYTISAPETIAVHLPSSLLHSTGNTTIGGTVNSEGIVVLPSRPLMRLREDGLPYLFIDAATWTQDHEVVVPPNGLAGRPGLLASEVRTGQLEKNLTLILGQGSRFLMCGQKR